ncbi:DUF4153 domain-containing protein [Yoonia sediminilitoris]|uniref:Uncharacterized protein DUF4173 n=1 Tax=Yoonia sediminilitoris TaxID=1286148 RepID=A0A2T6KFN1_9RHOB|nr:DUF4173 domain-containing protein [Yoonia sediminilitoris]PUB14132.1 uncharacterized protein DUF4173 [Yoonia sediminilitoris]RCW95063.1 uncharacterized protein DUF4173 [Yoonia sediminilitoris]
MVVRGVPRGLAKDGWWLDDDGQGKWRAPAVVMLVIVALADVLLWHADAGLGLVGWIIAIAAAIHMTLSGKTGWSHLAIGWGALTVCLIPAFIQVQFLSVCLAIAGLLGFAAHAALGKPPMVAILSAMFRLPGRGAVQVWRDAMGIRFAVPTGGTVKSALFDWLLPVGVGGVFLLLLVAANPIVEGWMRSMALLNRVSLDLPRHLFWLGVALMVWPFLRLSVLGLQHPSKRQFRAFELGLFNARSVLRALVVFNLIFAVQTFMDIGVIWGGVSLPGGMTYARYTHQGAYPLLVTALLAGVFALIAQPFLTDRPWVRGLMYLWVGQTVLLVVSSLLRLDLYIDAYGLTRLRVAALVWMCVVAVGLLLMLVQMIGRKTVGWFGLRAGGLGVLALYMMSLVSIDGIIARHNLADDRPRDHYVCTLSEGALPAIVAFELAQGTSPCHRSRPRLHIPQDWREWGYRNAMLRRSLAQLEVSQ